MLRLANMTNGLEVKDIYWLAGLLEGEGCFLYQDTPRITLVMSDQDVVEEAATIMKAKVKYRLPKDKNWKGMYELYLCSYRAAGWMMTLYSLLGGRRQARVRQILQKFKQSNVRRVWGDECLVHGKGYIRRNKKTGFARCRLCSNKYAREFRVREGTIGGSKHE